LKLGAAFAFPRAAAADWIDDGNEAGEFADPFPVDLNSAVVGAMTS